MRLVIGQTRRYGAKTCQIPVLETEVYSAAFWSEELSPAHYHWCCSRHAPVKALTNEEQREGKQ